MEKTIKDSRIRRHMSPKQFRSIIDEHLGLIDRSATGGHVMGIDYFDTLSYARTFCDAEIKVHVNCTKKTITFTSVPARNWCDNSRIAEIS